MSMYGIRYILGFSSEKYNHDYRILVKEKDYTGGVENKALGSAPILRQDDSDSGISGTSLELVIQADVDGELTSLYTVDNKKFLVELYRGDMLLWCGYVLPEQYSEPYISVPYDVSVTASDGLGILKDIPFALTGERTLFDVIKYCCDQTSILLDFEFVSSLRESSMSENDVMQVQTKLDVAIFSGKTCYEVLESCMISLDSFITQSENRWCVAKYTDLDKKSLIYSNTGVKKGERYLDVGILGSIENDFYPIGNLEKEILPAYKSTKLSYDYGKKVSFLSNYNFSSELDCWEYTMTQRPTRVRHAYYDGEGFVRILGRSAIGGTAEEPSYIRQTVNVEKTDKSLTFIISHAMGMGIPEGNGEFNIKIKLVGNTRTYYLTKSGWRTVEDCIVVSSHYQGQHIMDETDMTRVDNYTEFKILSNGFPETGNLTIQIENPVVITDFRLYINKVIVTNDLPTGIDVDVNLNSNASTSYDSVDIAFGDTPVVANAKKLFSGILWNDNGFTRTWTNGNKTDSFFYTVLKCLCSRIGFPRQQLSGTIQGKYLRTFMLARDKYSNLLFHVKEASLNLLTDEMDCTLEQFMPYSELSGETSESARATGNSSEYRSSGDNEVRVYQSGSGVPMRIKDLSPTELQPDSVIEVDCNNAPKSGKATLLKLLEFILSTGGVWTKEELQVVEGYILYLGKKIKAGDSDLWEGHDFDDYLDQEVKRNSAVIFKSITSTGFETKVKGWIIDAMGDTEFRKLILREGFKTADFIPGVVGSGTGMVGTEDFTTGKLTVRNYMEVMALAVARVFWRGGRDVHSPSGMKVNKVEEYDDYWRCYMETSEGQKNTCTVGAQMRCNKYGDGKEKYYWNLVTGIGKDYIDLSKTDRDGVDVPEVGDELAQFGHRTDPNLSWILVISSMMEDAGMTMYAGVNSYTLSGKWAISVGKDPNGSNRVGVFTKNGEFSDVIEGLEDKVDNLQIGSVNLISRKMMLAWNEKNKDIAVWGQDSDGVYLNVNPIPLRNYISEGTNYKDVFLGEGNYKPNTQYVFSIEWKTATTEENRKNGLYLYVIYTDGSYELFFEANNQQTSKKRSDYITTKGKTIQKISSGYGYNINCLIYSIGLIEGNKIPADIPVATEDLTGQSNVNLVDGGKEFTVTAGANGNYVHKTLIVPLLKPNTVYHVSFKAENLVGTPDKYSAVLYNNEITSPLSTRADSNNGGILITKNNFTEGKYVLLLYAGVAGSCAGNSVKFTEVMLVEGFTPPSSYSPSPGDVAKDIKDVNDAVTNLNTTINGAFKDGIIDEAEAKAIASNINILNAEKADIDNAYTPLYNSPYLLSGTTAANNLNNAKTAYNTAHANLISAINTAIADKKVTSTEKANVDAKFTAYNSALGTYKKRVEEANKAIQDRIKALAEQDATNKVDNIQVGGTNLFPVSKLNPTSCKAGSGKEGSGTEIIFKCNTPQAWAIIPVSIPTPVVPTNTDFIISMDIRNTNGFGFEVTATSGTPTIFGKINFENTTSTWKRISKRYNSGDKNNIGGINLWGVGDVRHIKIEIGNKATDWSPAPEDVEADIQIGIRNLFLNSGKEVKNGSYNVVNYATSIDLVTGEKYTLVLRGTTTGGQQLGMWVNSGNGKVVLLKANMNDEVVFAHVTLPTINESYKRKIDFYNYPSSGATANPATIKWACLYEGHIKPPLDWVQAPEDIDKAIQNAIAKTVDITAPSQVFKYGAGYTGTPTPASIVLTAIPRNFTPTSYQWQYLNGSTWTNISGATSSTYSVAPGNTTLFPSGVYTRTFRCMCNGDEKLSDNFTLAKLADGATGAQGKDACTVLLTNEAHTVACDANGNPLSGELAKAKTKITAYKGTSKLAAVHSGATAGQFYVVSLTSVGGAFQLNGNDEITCTAMNADTASYTCKVYLESTSFYVEKTFVVTKAKTGATGQPGESINGKMLYKDPEFKLGMNGVSRYANTSGDILAKLTLERIAKPSDAPTQSGYCLKVTCKAAQKPGYGGVVQSIQSRANAVFIQKIIAKIPVGYKINATSNSMGTGYTDTWLTPTAGTGKYTTYLRKTVCGTTGTFSSGGHVFITGNPAPSEPVPLEWYIASMTAFDQTADGYADIEIVTKDSFAAQLGFTNFEALKANAVTKGPLVKAGMINTALLTADALIAVDGFIDKLKTNILTANAIKANMISIPGFTFKENNIIGGSDFGVGGGVKIVSTTAERSFKAYKDASHYVEMFYRNASDWGLKGVDGNPVFQLGSTNKIGPFTIEKEILNAKNPLVLDNGYEYDGGLILAKNHIYFKYAMGSIYQQSAYLGVKGGAGSNYGTNSILVVEGGDMWHQAGLFYASDIRLRGDMDVDSGSIINMANGSALKSGVTTYTMNGTNPSITLRDADSNIIYLKGSGNRKKVNLYPGMKLGTCFIISSETSYGYDVLCADNERFYRNGNNYLAVQSSGQDSVLVMKVDTYKWAACQMPVNWLGTWNP
ncbi:hypothetical protein [uncultured Butyricimonas sp.]|uniref:hypothetical protein n=1 Tax=uncultured Butyricimonas sp. TaxID=1268785 RepID=UPI0026DC0A9B|nr:hypothetical protein [uncultured Butyricimonas sp.]